MKRSTLVYADFTGGEFGTMNPTAVPDGMWTGQNVVVYRNGRIGPRPGVRRITFANNPSKDGPLLGFGFSPVAQTGNTPLFYILENRVYAFRPVSGADVTLRAASPDLAGPPPNTISEQVLSKESVRLIGDEVYFTVNQDKTYRLNLRGTPSAPNPVLTPIADSAEGSDIEQYRDRILVANGGNRIFYSDPADFDEWPSLNFFDVGAAYRILNMTEFRDALLIFTQSGQWAFSGTPDNGTLRRISDTLSPSEKAVVKTNDSVVYVPASRSAPVIFNGSFGDEESLAHLERWKSTDHPAFGVQSYGNRDVLFLSNQGDLLWRKNNAWTYHDVGVSGIGPWITRYFDDHVVLATRGSSSVDPQFFMLPMTLDRPAFVTDEWARPGDNTDTPLTAEFTLPDHVVKDGREERVNRIMVDFYAYDTGADEPNNIDLEVSTLLRENLPGDGTVSHNLFSESGEFASSAGVRRRAIFRHPPNGFGGGHRISFKNLRGVSIERILVDVEEQEAPVG